LRIALQEYAKTCAGHDKKKVDQHARNAPKPAIGAIARSAMGEFTYRERTRTLPSRSVRESQKQLMP
jgi:hypothetical protein